MPDITAGVVDVFPIRRRGDAWETLLLQRAEGTRCPGAWETVHGRIEPGERAEDAAIRELREETGLACERLYNVTVHGFYLHMLGAQGTVMLAIAFAAVVDAAHADDLTLGAEHARAEWVPAAEAAARYTWPRSRATLGEIMHLLRTGDAGVAEDVLRVR